MSEINNSSNDDKLLTGKKIYFSNTIMGNVSDENFLFGYDIVKFLKDNGADVVDEWVGGRNLEECKQ